jgi:NAD(P) transhydrogenase subunit alpha
MIIAVPAERSDGERRVALVPESVQRLTAKKVAVRVESGAGRKAWFTDDDYRRSGASMVPHAALLLGQSDLVVKVGAPTPAEAEAIRYGAALVCFLYPRDNSEITRALALQRVTAVAIEQLPRTTLAQSMDVLSSQSTAAGYRAVIAAANALAKFFPMLMTPAGSIAPARVLVLGAGVAGLQAIATARRLGAVVAAFDVRPATRQDVESLGATFIDAGIGENLETAEGYAIALNAASLHRARTAIHPHLTNADVCITTALVPCQRAPVLITNAMVQSMRPGAVIVDLAAESGGNCELTEPGKEIVRHDVAILGRLNLAADLAADASRMYSRNMEKVIEHFLRDGFLRFDFRDEITRRCVVTHDGEIVDEELRHALDAASGGRP